MIKHILYAVLLGVGMAACLSDRDTTDTTANETDNELVTAAPTAETEETTPDPAMLLIARTGVGGVQIGMPVTEMRQQVHENSTIADTTLQQEGQQATAYILRQQQRDKGLLIEQECEPDCRVWRINVQSREYHTPEGIGVGSKFSEVQQHYNISYVSQAEGKIVAVSESAGMSFVLANAAVPPGRANLTHSDIPANAIVKSILLY